MIGNYIVLVKENNMFKFKNYYGDFTKFLGDCPYKICFRFRIPKLLNFKKQFNNVWYQRFCEDFYFLNSSGIPIIESILIFKNNADKSKLKNLKEFYNHIHQKLLKGNSLYESFSSTNYKLDNIFTSLIKVSEETGKLSEVLENLNNYYSEKIKISNKVKSSLLYPLMLFIVLIILLNICILFFIPTYVNSFQTQLSNLPKLSQSFINVCLYIKENYFLFVSMTVIFVTLIFKFLKLNNISNPLLSKFTIFRKIYFKNCQLKFIQILYYIINSGIDISTALKIMINLEEKSYSTYAKYVYIEINQGFDFCEALSDTKIFDEQIISIIKVGEKSSRLDMALKNIWTTYSKKYYESIYKSTKLIEPIFIIICGIMVLIFVSVFILPLISYDNFSYIWGG